MLRCENMGCWDGTTSYRCCTYYKCDAYGNALHLRPTMPNDKYKKLSVGR